MQTSLSDRRPVVRILLNQWLDTELIMDQSTDCITREVHAWVDSYIISYKNGKYLNNLADTHDFYVLTTRTLLFFSNKNIFNIYHS